MGVSSYGADLVDIPLLLEVSLGVRTSNFSAYVDLFLLAFDEGTWREE
jgi:hypothetical protein